MARVAFARAVEVSLARLRIAREYVQHLRERPASQRIVHLLMKKIRQIAHLRRCEATACNTTLRRMTLVEKWSDRVAVAVMENNQRAHKIGSVTLTPRSRAMARDALGYID